jgi:peptidoglycan/LPS O-acetylase OafA/YrhL
MDDRVFFGSDTRANEILIGCFFAFLPMRRISGQLARAWLIPAAFLGILAIVGSPVWLRVVDTFLIAIGAVWLIAAVHHSRRTLFTRFLESDVCTAVGRLSYSLYLWHFPIMLTLGPRGLVSPESLPVASLGLSFAAAAFSYHLIETPFLRMKDCLRPAKFSALAALPEREYPARI